ncbi:NADPH:quinone oxidoreductase family protein [Bradyrhizobium jicamae]|uniref:NADPH:quinone oxidoreductase family protein n=1 Tax=Bradyrhizobium jicamae TaxID=280332 RepID=A0ABS5FXD0_9BRAD|nr:NADPH:quinone oxidoreductase family protein [Bradyrhizobium jicamae]MBR0801452.1 NADPH:quinone oxidoreductase family protein [Bradyrhizobium jicamae]MBR0939106.1 NADPH:quinone oxidoreductase family protein [Bradyrhizobium jicamae]
MKAVVVEHYAPIDQIGLKEVAQPATGPGQIRVRVHAASIGFVDGLKVEGRYQTRDPLPFTPGAEFAGVVDDVAGDVMGLAAGMRVMGAARSGALAETIVVPASAVEIMPDGLSMEAAAAFRTNYLTALYALGERGSLRAGEQLLVLGAAGGTGIAAIQVGKLLGARVIAAASTEEKRNFAASFGADAVVDYTRTDWRDALKDLTGGHGADVIFDPVGGEVSVQAFRSIAWNGRHIVVGFAAGSIPALPFNLPLLKGGILVGVDAAQIARREPDAQARVMTQLSAWLNDGKLTPVVGQVFAFEDFRAAFRTMQTRAALGKMVVKIGA